MKTCDIIDTIDDTEQNKSLAAITALICTRNRGASLVQTLDSILANDHPNFSLIVVDQSPNGETAAAVAPYLGDPRLDYFRSNTSGVARARNIGIDRATTQIVAMTDDDCIVPSDWLRQIQSAFEEDSKIGVVFCNVEAQPHDPADGFVPAYERNDSLLIKKISQKNQGRGIGAGLAVRRNVMTELGGFDELLGACEDGDIAVRALLKGYYVYETHTTSVIHYGFRFHHDGRALAYRNWRGIGACYMKPLKCGHFSITSVINYEFWKLAFWPVFKDLISLKRPRGVTAIFAFLQGMGSGLWMPVDPRTLLYKIPPRPKS